MKYASVDDLERALKSGIADIKDDLNMLAMCGAVPMWTSLIGRLDDLSETLFPDSGTAVKDRGE